MPTTETKPLTCSKAEASKTMATAFAIPRLKSEASFSRNFHEFHKRNVKGLLKLT
jgi:hypothetical protein